MYKWRTVQRTGVSVTQPGSHYLTYKDNEGGIHKGGQISLSCTERDEGTIRALAQSEIIIFTVELDFLALK